MSKNSWPQSDETESLKPSNDAPEGQVTDNSYATEKVEKDTIPVLKDDEPVEDPIDSKTADSDKALGEIPGGLMHVVEA
jgi:hypothetical protein